MTASHPALAQNHGQSTAADERAQGRAVPLPGCETSLMLQRLSNWQSRVPTRNPNTVKGSRQRPVELFPLTHDPLTLEPL